MDDVCVRACVRACVLACVRQVSGPEVECGELEYRCGRDVTECACSRKEESDLAAKQQAAASRDGRRQLVR
jgi:hypothetical protein